MTRTPAISSARSPTTLATRVRVSRKAVRARRENQMVTRIIKGNTVKVSSARRGLMLSMMTMMPTSTRASPNRVMMPWESSSLIVATSFITRETVTPTMWVSW